MHDATFTIRTWTAIVAFAIALAGCSTTVVEPDPVAVQIEPVEALPMPLLERRSIDYATPQPRPVIKPASISVVLSSRAEAYEEIANALGEYFEGFSVYDLSDRSQPPVTAFRLINDSDTDAVIAIGLRAAQSSVAMSNTPVVFSQVFNYAEHGLLSEISRGIAAVPPPGTQLAEWKRIDPSLKRVGMILGPGHEELVEAARIAASEHGVELLVHEANSDQETLYVFRRMMRKIDGYWLIPDNRVLSKRVINEILTESRNRDVQVLAPSDAMLEMGAALSITSVAADIAAQIHMVVKQIHDSGIASVAAITPLSAFRIVTSDERVAHRAVAESVR